MATEAETPKLEPGRRKLNGERQAPLWWTPERVEQALEITGDGRRRLMKRGLLTGIWPYGRGRGKPVRFDPKEVQLLALGAWDELKQYQRDMGRTKAKR